MGPGARRLSESLARAVAAGRQRTRGTSAALAFSPYRSGSWRAQAILHRSAARWKLIVSGRGVGKTHGGAYELLHIVMAAPPGSEGAVLAPTLTHAEAAVSKLRELASALPGVTAASWVVSKRRLMLPGGRSIKVFSAERKEVVRGPSIVALWIDEGALLSHTALEASLPAMRRPGFNVRLLVTTTPAGKNWVWNWWDKRPENLERFRFRGTDSPYNDKAVIELYRATASPEKFAQEYLAEFVDNLLLVFPDREGLFVDTLPVRAKRPACWLGVDLGKRDHTVCTLANEWQEVQVVGRWNEDTPGFNESTFWAQTYDRVEQLATDSGATVVVDTGGAGGAAGAVLAEHLRGKGLQVVEIKTSQQGTKAQIVEQAKADVQWKKLRVLRNDMASQLDYEMSKFQGIKRIRQGREEHVYEGPQVPGEFDDCVISFCLANWGRVHAEKVPDPLSGDFSGFADGTEFGRRGGTESNDLGEWAP